MAEAMAEAAVAAALGEVPVGAVAVSDGRIVARARNEREGRADPTAHAEILVLQLAAAAMRIGSSEARSRSVNSRNASGQYTRSLFVPGFGGW